VQIRVKQKILWLVKYSRNTRHPPCSGLLFGFVLLSLVLLEGGRSSFWGSHTQILAWTAHIFSRSLPPPPQSQKLPERRTTMLLFFPAMGMLRRLMTLTTAAAIWLLLLLSLSLSKTTTTLAQQILIDDFELTTELGRKRPLENWNPVLSLSLELSLPTPKPNRGSLVARHQERRAKTSACQWLLA
jgi:hypothetical protein